MGGAPGHRRKLDVLSCAEVSLAVFNGRVRFRIVLEGIKPSTMTGCSVLLCGRLFVSLWFGSFLTWCRSKRLSEGSAVLYFAVVFNRVLT